MRKINSLSDLLMEELTDLLNAENFLIEAMPQITQACHSLKLKRILEAQLEITKRHAKRLRDIFSNIRQNPKLGPCKVMKKIIKEGLANVHNKIDKAQAGDISIISMMHKVKQFEISRYAKANKHAADLGHTKMVELLSQTINEEREMNLHISELAQGTINVQAIDPRNADKKLNQRQEHNPNPNAGGFYIPEERFRRKSIKSKNTDISRFISEGNPNIQEDRDKDKK